MGTPSPERSCQNCIYFDPATEPQRGLCRRNSPNVRGHLGYAVWPQVRATDWCGSHVLGAAPLSAKPTPLKSIF